MEAAIRSGVKERVLAVGGGRYADRFARVAAACGKEVIRVMVHPGRALEAEHLQQFLDGPEVDAVALVHAEGSTGALAPLAELAAVVRARKDVLLLVDASGSVGGMPVETDAWGLDFVFAGIGQGPRPSARPHARRRQSSAFIDRSRRLEARGYYLDLARADDRVSRGALQFRAARCPSCGPCEAQWPRSPPPVASTARWKRHLNCSRWSRNGPCCGRTSAPAGAPGTTGLDRLLPYPARGRHSADLVAALRHAAGWSPRAGGTLRDSSIRIGHMGEVTVEDLREFLESAGGGAVTR